MLRWFISLRKARFFFLFMMILSFQVKPLATTVTMSGSAVGFVSQSIFTSSGTFTPPLGVTSVRVLVVGGGGGGAGGHAGGGGSGHVRTGTFTISGPVAITIGSGGSGGSGGSDANSSGSASAGGSSSFGPYLTAGGGSGGQASSPASMSGAPGGSGGGGGGNCGTAGSGGANGYSGKAGIGGSGNGGGGAGGNFDSVSLFQNISVTGGVGGEQSVNTCSGGGGAGGVLIDGEGPSGSPGTIPSSASTGGRGYGAGGGGGGYNGNYYAGGAGASGVVYVEWGSRPACPANQICPGQYSAVSSRDNLKVKCDRWNGRTCELPMLNVDAHSCAAAAHFEARAFVPAYNTGDNTSLCQFFCYQATGSSVVSKCTAATTTSGYIYGWWLNTNTSCSHNSPNANHSYFTTGSNPVWPSKSLVVHELSSANTSVHVECAGW